MIQSGMLVYLYGYNMLMNKQKINCNLILNMDNNLEKNKRFLYIQIKHKIKNIQLNLIFFKHTLLYLVIIN